MSNVWMDDGQQDTWYGKGASHTNMSWRQFDYSQHQDPNQHYNNSQSYYQHQNPYTQSHSYYGGQMFMPLSTNGGSVSGGVEDYENEPPLLDELDINFSHIKEKTFAVLSPSGTASAEVIADQDLAGPLVFCLLFGFSLLLHGKMTFGYIYGIGALGCLGMYLLMNLMAADKTISFICTASVLGYCLLPMSLLSLVTAVLSSKGVFGYSISALAVIWCSSSSSKLFVIALSMDHQRLLVAYPCVLLYSVFALLAIF